jgi:hypothetical protein
LAITTDDSSGSDRFIYSVQPETDGDESFHWESPLQQHTPILIMARPSAGGGGGFFFLKSSRIAFSRPVNFVSSGG